LPPELDFGCWDDLPAAVGQWLLAGLHAAGAAGHRNDVTRLMPLDPGGPCGPGPALNAAGEERRLATDSSTVYNVGMAERAMQEATFLILTALADGSQHGYGIITEVAQISGGRVRLRAGTLYTALDRLRSDELIGMDREEIVDGRLRRYYRLTPAGGWRRRRPGCTPMPRPHCGG
jgi:hypothetical protein